ncbi:MAG: hypothetical protein ACK40G_10065 [Cytophagaceae bacterium]
MKSLLPHLAAAGLMLVILFIYFSPVLSGKKMVQSDVIQFMGSLKEANTWQEKTGDEILWSNSSFGGMAVWRGFGKNILTHIHYGLNDILPNPVLLCFLSFLGFYILMKAYKANNYISFIAAAAYTFASFNFISIEAGHINKVYNMALMSPILAGVVWAFRGRYLTGAAITALFLSLQIFYGHIQITYYLIILLVIFGIAELIFAVRNKTLPVFIKATGFLIVAAAIAVGPNISKLWTMVEYSKATTRGGAVLSTAAAGEDQGLDKEYALAWSNGIMETFTLFIPNFYGGSSHEDVGKNSEVYNVLSRQGYQKEAKNFSENVPLYWGDQPFTSGPVYIGAIVCFLFVLGLFLIKGSTKWWILAATVLAIMLSWGRNLMWFTDIFYYYVPLYNKFRSVTMILSVVQVTAALLAFITLKEILSGNIEKKEIMNGLKWSTIITGGLALIFALLGSAFFDFSSENDAKVFSQLPDWLQNAIIDDRQSKFRADAFRSLFFVVAAAGAIWAVITDKIKPVAFYVILGGLILLDMFPVSKRYLNNDDFKYRKNPEKQIFTKSPADEKILADSDPYFRVFNTTQNLTSDALTSYFHKSLGGYSAIKLRRYQDIIDSALTRSNMDAINMLNTKYFIIQDKQSGQLTAQRNPGALGNAWFVKDYKFVDNPDEEIKAIQDFDPSATAIVDKEFQQLLEGKSIQFDSSASIELTNYHPNKLSYKSISDTEQLAVFSDIYYQPGWDAYVNGNLVPHFRTNYILRAMIVPAGENKIEFVFEPRSYYLGEKLSLAGSIILLIFIAGIFGWSVKNKLKEENE